jgi:ferredoxin
MTTLSPLEEKLMVLARNLKLEVYDIDDAIYGYEPVDNKYGIEVLKTNVKIDPSLGLELTELARGESGQGLVLISSVSGNAAEASPAVHVGDAITGILSGDGYKERTIGVDYDFTVDAIAAAKQHATNGYITLQINRLVPKAKITVEVDDGKKIHTLQTLAGENLRTLLLRKQVQLYDPKTKRFDQPFSTGDCAGEGICGTCLVSVERGAELLNEKSDLEKFITKGRPHKWRAACRTIVGADNREGTIRICTHPQTGHEDELNPGVKDVSLESQ